MIAGAVALEAGLLRRPFLAPLALSSRFEELREGHVYSCRQLRMEFVILFPTTVIRRIEQATSNKYYLLVPQPHGLVLLSSEGIMVCGWRCRRIFVQNGPQDLDFRLLCTFASFLFDGNFEIDDRGGDRLV